MRQRPLPWSDSIRLLQKRRTLVSDLTGSELGDSIQAFLAWKAFVVVARGTTPSAREKNQCQELLRVTLEAYPVLTERVTPFLRGLEALARQTDSVMAQWYCDDDADGAKQEQEVARARRRIRKLLSHGGSSSLSSADAAYDVGDNLYAVRSAVIAHASVLTTGNLFANIVPPFGHLAATAACAGIAVRADVALDSVLEEAGVINT